MEQVNKVIDWIKNEPVIVLLVAGLIVAFGVDLTALEETIERLVQLGAILGFGFAARRQVTPTRKLPPPPTEIEGQEGSTI